MEKIRFFISTGYAGKAKAEVEIDEKYYLIDDDHLKAFIEKAITERGYHIEQNNRQKYPRLFIND